MDKINKISEENKLCIDKLKLKHKEKYKLLNNNFNRMKNNYVAYKEKVKIKLDSKDNEILNLNKEISNKNE